MNPGINVLQNKYSRIEEINQTSTIARGTSIVIVVLSLVVDIAMGSHSSGSVSLTIEHEPISFMHTF